MGALVMRHMAILVTVTLVIVACGTDDPTPIPDPSGLQAVGVSGADADPSDDAAPRSPSADTAGPSDDTANPSDDGQGTTATTDVDIDDVATSDDVGPPSPQDASEGSDAQDAAEGSDAQDTTLAPEQDSASSEDASPETGPDSDAQAPIEDIAPPQCEPDCAGLNCGDDGCGGSCGQCSGQDLCVAGVCTCQPDCAGSNCGDDGCGGSCGTCGGQDLCQGGLCVCQPQCPPNSCGDDGCGGTCGPCSGQDLCQGGLCVCQPQCPPNACGDDGCGGTCNSCSGQDICLGGSCVCQPDCAGKACGDDGCSGSCGSCEDNNPCTIDFCAEDQSCAASELALVPCDSPPCAVNDGCLYDLARSGLSTTERIVAISLQGVLAQSRPAIWLGEGQSMPLHQARLEDDYGVSFVKTSDLWDLVSRFSGALSGYLLYDPATSSQNVALSLAGVLGAVAISPDLEAQAQAQGLSLVQDVRGLDELWCWESYAGQFAEDMLVEHSEDYGWGEWLLDFPIARRAFIYFDDTCGDLRTELASQLDAPLIYGWGEDCGEYDFVKGASEGGASVVAADYASNLSVLSNVVGVPVTGNNHAPDDLQTEDNVHYVAFVMSDGDNIQFIQNAFNDPRWWGSPHRGAFPMTWEMSPVLPDPAPTFLQWIYASATPNDQSVAAPSGAGYALPSVHTDPQGFAEKTATAMAQTDMRVLTILNSAGGLEAGDAFTERPEIDAVIYKDFADYNALQGAIRWSNGKPIVSFRYLLWNNNSAEDSPQGVAQSINNAPTNPKGDIGSYSLVNVHAWSEWPGAPLGTGAMAATAWTVSMFDDDVRVVSAEALLKHMSAHLGGSTSGSTDFVFEAETDLSHQMGYADGQGWACNTADQTAGHMCYGPYTSAVPAGSYNADFDLMVDVPGPPATDDLVVTLDVFDSLNGTSLVTRDITRYEFNAPFAYQTFALPFTYSGGGVLEFRVFWHATSYVNVDKVVVQ